MKTLNEADPTALEAVIGFIESHYGTDQGFLDIAEGAFASQDERLARFQFHAGQRSVAEKLRLAMTNRNKDTDGSKLT